MPVEQISTERGTSPVFPVSRIAPIRNRFQGRCRNAVLFFEGALILVFCFFTAMNILYRQIFLLALLPYMFDSRRNQTRSSADRYFWTSAIALIIALLWLNSCAPMLLSSQAIGWVWPRTLRCLFESRFGGYSS